MIAILVSYQTCLKNRLSFAFQILMILFVNELGYSLSKLLRFCNINNTVLCSLSIVLATGFSIAASTYKSILRFLDVLHFTRSSQRVHSTWSTHQYLDSHDSQHPFHLYTLYMYLCTHWCYALT
jgi:hypothetical protein